MTLDPNNLVFFYFILALLAVAIGLVAYASAHERSKPPK